MRSFLKIIDTDGDGLCNGATHPDSLLAMISRVASSDTTVLLQGETGTGKEVAARAIHSLSSRAHGKFVPLDCSSLRDALLDSELFGHECGAFTGAVREKMGLVEFSNGGTLFLDEIGDVPVQVQLKLLRLLENRTFRRVGGTAEHQADFRLICASQNDLSELIDKGAIRQDFYYRISAFPISLPPLRERLDELPTLITALKRRLGCTHRCTLSADVEETLRRYRYPGNVRELLHILEHACLMAGGGRIEIAHLGRELFQRSSPIRPHAFSKLVPLTDLESSYLRWAVEQFRGSRKELAQRLGVSERSLYRKLSELRIE